jgi:hypothetical protein
MNAVPAADVSIDLTAFSDLNGSYDVDLGSVELRSTLALSNPHPRSRNEEDTRMLIDLDLSRAAPIRIRLNLSDGQLESELPRAGGRKTWPTTRRGQI